MTDRDQLVVREEVKIKIGDQWFYRGNRSPTWLFLAERLDGSPCGISEKVPTDWYPLLEEIARLLSLLPKEGDNGLNELEWLQHELWRRQNDPAATVGKLNSDYKAMIEASKK